MTMSHRRFYGRVVIALDACTPRAQALEVAARFAAAGESELVGLFVEDIDLINLSALPISREISLRGVGTRAMEPAQLERQLRRAADEARAQLSALAESMSLRWRFEVVRGEPARELVSAAEKTDLLVLCEDSDVSDPRRAALGVGIVARDLAVVGSVLIGRRMRAGHGGVVGLIQSGGCSQAVIERAAALAAAYKQPLVLYVVAQGDEDLLALKARAEDALAGAQPLVLRRWPDFDRPDLAETINAFRPGLVVMCAGGDDALQENRLRRLASRLDAPILFMRADD